MSKPRDQIAQPRTMPLRGFRRVKVAFARNPLERRRRLRGNNAPDIAQRDRDVIGIWKWCRKHRVKRAECLESGGVVERVEKIAQARSVLAEVLLRVGDRIIANLLGVDDDGILHVGLPFACVNGGLPNSSASCSVHRGECSVSVGLLFGGLNGWCVALVTRTLVVLLRHEGKICGAVHFL